MTKFSFWYPGDEVVIWGVNVLLQITLVAALGLFAARWMRQNPAARCWVLCATLFLMLVSPATSFLIQSSDLNLLSVSLLDDPHTQTRPQATSGNAAAPKSEVRAGDFASLPVFEQFATIDSATGNPSERHTARSTGKLDTTMSQGSGIDLQTGLPFGRAGNSSLAPGDASPAFSLGTILRITVPPILMVWWFGALLLLVRLLRGWWRLECVHRAARPLMIESLEATAAEICRALGMSWSPQLVSSPDVSGPLAAGIRHPRVILPDGLVNQIQRQELRDILIHELAHICRRDQLVVLLQNLAAAVFWIHPLVRVVNRELARAREDVCDNYVLASTDAPSYSRTLLRLAELIQRSDPLPASVGLLASRWKLEARVAGLLDQRRQRVTRLTGNGSALVLLLSVMFAAIGAAVTIGAATQASDERETGSQLFIAADKERNPESITIRGTVLTPDGKPAAGARVYAIQVTTDPWTNNETLRLLAEALSHDDGAFSLMYAQPDEPDQRGVVQEKLRNSRVQFIASHGAHAIGFSDERRPRAEDVVRIQLARKEALSGRLIDLEGRPMAGVRLEVQSIAQANEPLDKWFQLAAQNPRPKLTYDYYSVAAKEKKNARPRPVGFPSSQRAALEGTNIIPRVETGADGRFTIPSIGPDRLVVMKVTAPMVARTTVKLVTHRGPDVFDVSLDSRVRDAMIHGADATIAMERAVAIKGVVSDAGTGQPIAGCKLEVMQVPGTVMTGRDFAETTTDAAGQYVIDQLPPDSPNSGGYQISVTPPADAPYFQTDFKARLTFDNQQAAFDVRLQRARWITGRITDDKTGQPIRAMVGFLPMLDNTHASAYSNFVSGMRRTSRLDDLRWNEPDGSFRVPAINGRGVLCVTAERMAAYALAGHADRIDGLQREDFNLGVYHLIATWMVNEFREINLSEADPDPTIDVALRPLRRHPVRIVDAAGQPVSGCHETGLMPDTPFANRRPLSLDAPLLFDPPLKSSDVELVGLEIESPRPVAIHHADRNIGTVVMLREADARNEIITVTLHPCGRIRGRLLDDSGKPVSGGQLHAFALLDEELPKPTGKSRSRPSFFVFPETVQTNADGRFEIARGVLPGVRYKINVRGGGPVRQGPTGEPIVLEPPTKETPVVQPGQTIDVGDIAFQPAT